MTDIHKKYRLNSTDEPRRPKWFGQDNNHDTNPQGQ